jgi:catechol 2,3-dioxygenase
VSAPIDPGVSIGHVHLKVADLERAVSFYCDILGFELTQRYGRDAAFVSAGGYHHHIGLNQWESRGGSPPLPGTTGLYHFAIRYPSRAALADALRRLMAAGVPLEGASDHGVSQALYLRDPDQNGIELYWDRPPRGVAAGRGRHDRDAHQAAGRREPAHTLIAVASQRHAIHPPPRHLSHRRLHGAHRSGCRPATEQARGHTRGGGSLLRRRRHHQNMAVPAASHSRRRRHQGLPRS